MCSYLLKAYQQELGARANTVEFVRKRAKELMDKSEGDMSQQQAELIELSTLWDRVCKLSVNKQERLEQAHKLVSIETMSYLCDKEIPKESSLPVTEKLVQMGYNFCLLLTEN